MRDLDRIHCMAAIVMRDCYYRALRVASGVSMFSDPFQSSLLGVYQREGIEMKESYKHSTGHVSRIR
jgi:hypothetical protein